MKSVSSRTDAGVWFSTRHRVDFLAFQVPTVAQPSDLGVYKLSPKLCVGASRLCLLALLGTTLPWAFLLNSTRTPAVGWRAQMHEQ